MYLRDYITKVCTKINNNDIDNKTMKKYTEINDMLLNLFNMSREKVYKKMYMLIDNQHGGDIDDLKDKVDELYKEGINKIPDPAQQNDFNDIKAEVDTEINKIIAKINEINAKYIIFDGNVTKLTTQLNTIANQLQLFLSKTQP